MANALADLRESPTRDLYKLLWSYYSNNGLYETLRDELSVMTDEREIHPLRNPVNRAVEFYVAKMWPGTAEQAWVIEADNESIIEPIQQVWRWSNMDARKQRMVRWFTIFGEMFVKVAVKRDSVGKVTRVYQQVLDPSWVSDFDLDERGFLTFIRMDYQAAARLPSGLIEPYFHTEVWSKQDGVMMIWDHKRGLDAKLETLGPPGLMTALSDFGIDFIPIVYAPMRDIGGDGERGNGCFTHALDKIDEANRLVSSLHSRLFRYNRPDKALVGVGTDTVGRPLPPPSISDETDDESVVTYGEERFYKLPSGWKIETIVPQLAWDSALKILQDHMMELEHDMPELAYWRISEARDLSGKAIRMIMSGAIDRVLEARGNGEAAMVRANQMALTIGVQTGLFAGIGSFEEGDLEHRFKSQEVLPLGETDKAEIMKNYAGAQVPLVISAKHAGWTEEEIEELDAAEQKEKAEAQAAMANALGAAGAEMDKGGNLSPDDQAKMA